MFSANQFRYKGFNNFQHELAACDQCPIHNRSWEAIQFFNLMIFHFILKIHFLITFSPYGAMTVLEWFGFLDTGESFQPEHWGK